MRGGWVFWRSPTKTQVLYINLHQLTCTDADSREFLLRLVISCESVLPFIYFEEFLKNSDQNNNHIKLSLGIFISQSWHAQMCCFLTQASKDGGGPLRIGTRNLIGFLCWQLRLFGCMCGCETQIENSVMHQYLHFRIFQYSGSQSSPDFNMWVFMLSFGQQICIKRGFLSHQTPAAALHTYSITLL